MLITSKSVNKIMFENFVFFKLQIFLNLPLRKQRKRLRKYISIAYYVEHFSNIYRSYFICENLNIFDETTIQMIYFILEEYEPFALLYLPIKSFL
jgi:hypothetical protein